MKLLVQEFLESHSFKELQENHGVYASFSKSEHKFSLNYDQIEAKESDPLAQECRGLILSLPDGSPIVGTLTPEGKMDRGHIIPGETKILAFPMKRFFNSGQGAAIEIDWSDPDLVILEKLDGSLCIVYWDPFTCKWCVATRAVPEADLIMDNNLFTFRSLFEKAVQETLNIPFDVFTNSLVKDMTYCFELTTPYNRIVVQYDSCKITLLAVRYLATLEEVNPKNLALVQMGQVPVAVEYSYSSIDDLVNWVSSLNPLEHEGVVIRTKLGRVKVKNAQYVAFNKVRDALGTSERNCLELILGEKDDDVTPMLPEEIVKNLQKIKLGLHKVIMKYDSVHYLMMLNLKALGQDSNKKEFAALVANHPDMWSAPFFQMFSGKASSMKDFIFKNKKNGSWAASFLDKLLELSKNI